MKGVLCSRPITLTVAKCWDPTPKGYFTLPPSKSNLCSFYRCFTCAYFDMNYLINVHASACVCQDIEHAGSLESTKEV